MVDASNGELLWMLGYDQDVSYTGAVPPVGELRTEASDTEPRLLTKEEEFNFPIPTALTAVDKDNNGYVDTLYFGNIGGHLFKTDISGSDPLAWKTHILFKTVIVDKAASTISEIDDTLPVFTLEDKAETAGFAAGDSVMGKTSYATGYIRELYLKTITVTVTSGTFQVDEQIASRTYDPIYLAPSLTYDRCFKLWTMIGTGDRDRPRTNKTNGHFVIFKENGTYLHQVDNDVTSGDDTQYLQDLSDMWVDDTLTYTSLVDVNGWYFKFPDTAEKLFDPEPVMIPDKDFNPRLIFNTYQPPAESVKSVDNPCISPDEGTMTLYELLLGCGLNDTIGGDTQQGRIAGGGVYGGKEYILYEGTDGNVASAPGSDEQGDSNIGTRWSDLGYHGGIVFWKEKKR
jgi:Tfp pilus tip-associated adhesin PilY1